MNVFIVFLAKDISTLLSCSKKLAWDEVLLQIFSGSRMYQVSPRWVFLVNYLIWFKILKIFSSYKVYKDFMILPQIHVNIQDYNHGLISFSKLQFKQRLARTKASTCFISAVQLGIFQASCEKITNCLSPRIKDLMFLKSQHTSHLSPHRSRWPLLDSNENDTSEISQLHNPYQSPQRICSHSNRQYLLRGDIPRMNQFLKLKRKTIMGSGEG